MTALEREESKLRISIGLRMQKAITKVDHRLEKAKKITIIDFNNLIIILQ